MVQDGCFVVESRKAYGAPDNSPRSCIGTSRTNPFFPPSKVCRSPGMYWLIFFTLCSFNSLLVDSHPVQSGNPCPSVHKQGHVGVNFDRSNRCVSPSVLLPQLLTITCMLQLFSQQFTTKPNARSSPAPRWRSKSDGGWLRRKG